MRSTPSSPESSLRENLARVSSDSAHPARLYPQTSNQLYSYSSTWQCLDNAAAHRRASSPLHPAERTLPAHLENPQLGLPTPELRQNHVNSNLVSGWAVAEEPPASRRMRGSGRASERIPSHTLRSLRLSTRSRWSQGAAFGKTPSLELRQALSRSWAPKF